VQKNPKDYVHIIFYIITFVLLIVNIMPSFIVLNTQIFVKLICLVGMSLVETLYPSFYSLMSSRHDYILKKLALCVSKRVDRFDINTNCF